MTLDEALKLAAANFKKPESTTIILCNDVRPIRDALSAIGVPGCGSSSHGVGHARYKNHYVDSVIMLRSFKNAGPESFRGWLGNSFLGIAIDLPLNYNGQLDALKCAAYSENSRIIEIKTDDNSEARFARRLMMSDPEFMRSISLSDGEIKVIKLVGEFNHLVSQGMASIELSAALDKSLANASAKLKKLFTKGYLSRVQSDDPTGGVIYSYRVKRL